MRKSLIILILLGIGFIACKTETVKDTAYFLRHPAEGVSQADKWYKEKKLVESYQLCEALMNKYKGSSMVNSCITHNLNISSHYYKEWNKVIAKIENSESNEEKHKAIDAFIASKPLPSYIEIAQKKNASIN